MLTNYLGIINSYGNNALLKSLTLYRGISTVPIGGKYRAIDFQLSSMVNAGIKTINVLTDKNCKSLRRHLEVSKSWGLNRKNGGLFIQSDDVSSDTELLLLNFDSLYERKEEMLVIMPTYMIGNFDLLSAMKCHESSEADVTVVYKNIHSSNDKFVGCDILAFDENNVLEDVSKTSEFQKNINISTEIFLVKKDLLLSLALSRLSDDVSLKELFYQSKNNLTIKGFEHTGYLSCLNTLENYFRTNMDMLDSNNLKELFSNSERPIFSKIKDSIPTHYLNGADVKNAILSNECIVKGTVLNSVLSRYVTIEAGARVENCLIFQNCVIKSGSDLKNVIVDKDVIIEGDKLQGHPVYPLIIQKKDSNFVYVKGEK